MQLRKRPFKNESNNSTLNMDGENPAKREKKTIKKGRTAGVVSWRRAGRMGSSAHVEGLAFTSSTDGSPMVTEVTMEYAGTDECTWVDVVVGACGNSFLIASIFSEK